MASAVSGARRKGLQHNPGGVASLEQEIHRAFVQMAEWVVAGLLAQATVGSAFAAAAKKKVAPTDLKRTLRGGAPRLLRVRLLGGLLIQPCARRPDDTD